MRSWFTILAIPFDPEGMMDQDIDPETGEWIHRWDLPEGVVLCYRPLVPAPDSFEPE